jgi:hypothetical protein
MKRTILTVLLTLGLVGGLVAGIAGCEHRRHHREQFEAHIADVCISAAERVLEHRP